MKRLHRGMERGWPADEEIEAPQALYRNTPDVQLCSSAMLLPPGGNFGWNTTFQNEQREKSCAANVADATLTNNSFAVLVSPIHAYTYIKQSFAPETGVP